MPKRDKAGLVNELVEQLSGSSIVIATDYRGLSVAEMAELRHQLRGQGAKYRVVKNTLTNLAAGRAEKPELSAFLKGPTALALSSGDAILLAKALIDYQRSSKTPLNIKGGLLYGRILSASEISTLASLPSRDVLIAKLMGALYNPVYGLLYVLTAELRGLIGVLQGRIKQLEGR
jgi:large subunit ribosomal protein L10